MKRVVFVLAVLLSAYALFRWLSRPAPVRRQSKLEIPIREVDLLDLRPAGRPAVLLKKEPHAWIVSDGSWSTPARPEVVEDLLASIQQIPLYELVAHEPESWKRYGLDDDQALRLVAWANEEKIADVYIGRPATDSLHRCFIRVAGLPEVFAVPDLALSTIAIEPEAYIQNRLADSAALRDLRQWAYVLPDTTYRFFRQAGGDWLLQDSLPVRGDRVHRLLNALTRPHGQSPDMARTYSDSSLYVLGELHLGEPPELVITLARDSALEERAFLIHSSLYPALWHRSDSGGLYRELMPPISYFLPTSKENR